MNASSNSRRIWLHLRLGWVWLFLFATLGLVLEGLHGLKAGFYLDVGMETRRLMWTLMHSHGTLIGIVHLAFALTLERLDRQESALSVASHALVAAGVLLPVGFFLGGVVTYGGDPGLGVLLVPIGAVSLIVATGIVVYALKPPRDRQ